MTKEEFARRARLERELRMLGFGPVQVATLRRASGVLRRWFEEECNGTIQRDDTTEIPYRYAPDGGRQLGKVPDRETKARGRIAEIVATVPKADFYIQSDPRGASLYIIRPGDVPVGEDVEAYYTRGICVY